MYDDFEKFMPHSNIIVLAETLVVICIVVYILFILTIQNLLRAIPAANRKIHPLLAWTLIVPYLVNIARFFVVYFVSQSIDAELKQRGVQIKNRPTFLNGLVMSILLLISFILEYMYFIPLTVMIGIGIICIVGGLIFSIRYWIEILGYKKILKTTEQKTKPNE